MRLKPVSAIYFFGQSQMSKATRVGFCGSYFTGKTRPGWMAGMSRRETRPFVWASYGFPSGGVTST